MASPRRHPVRRPRPALRAALALVVLVAVLALGAVSVRGASQELDDADSAVDAAWSALRPTLDERYARVATLHAVLGAVVDPAADPMPATAAALEEWRTLAARRGPSGGATTAPSSAPLVAATSTPGLAPVPSGGDVDAEVGVATRLEGLVPRLVAIARSSDRLLADATVQQAVAAVETASVAAPAAAHRAAVERYEEVRDRFPARALAGLMGHDERRHFELPPTA